MSMNPTEPTDATEAVAVVTDEMIKKAWGFDPSVETYIYMALGAAYCASFLPSVSGLLIMGPARGALVWYLIYEAVVMFLDLDKMP